MLTNFIATHCLFETGQRVLSSRLYTHFTQTLSLKPDQVFSNKTFTQWIQKEFPSLVRKHTRSGQAWFGITLKDSYVPKNSGIKTPEQLATERLKVKNYHRNHYIKNKEQKTQRREERKSLDLELITRCGLDHSPEQILQRYRKWKQAGAFAYEYHQDKQIDWESSVRQTLENRARWNQSIAERSHSVYGSHPPRERQNKSRDSESGVTTVKKLPLGVPQLPKPKSRQAWWSSSFTEPAGPGVELHASGTPMRAPGREDSDGTEPPQQAPVYTGPAQMHLKNRVIKLRIRRPLPLTSLHSQLQQMTANKLEAVASSCENIAHRDSPGSPSATMGTSSVEIYPTKRCSSSLPPSDPPRSSVAVDPENRRPAEQQDLAVENTCIVESNDENLQAIRHPSSGSDVGTGSLDIFAIAPSIRGQVSTPPGLITPDPQPGHMERPTHLGPQSPDSAYMHLLSERSRSTSTPNDLTLADYARLENTYIQKREALSAAYEELLQRGPAVGSTEGAQTPDVRKALKENVNEVMKLVREWGKIRQPEPLMPNLQSSTLDVTLMAQVDAEHEEYIDWYSREEDRVVRGYTDDTMSEFLEMHGWQHTPKKREVDRLETDLKRVEMLYLKWSDACVQMNLK